MDIFNVYTLFNITPEKARGAYIWDKEGNMYLDLYGGHAVISIGHSHPHYISSISKQLNKIGFYSNSVINPLQNELCDKLGEISGYPDYNLFLCNSGAEANENALKLASFTTGRKKIISYKKAFHGRTSAAVAITDNPKIIAPVNETDNAVILPMNDIGATEEELQKGDVAAVIIEGIQGIGGINIPEDNFLVNLKKLTEKYGSLLILDEIQSGYGRSGRFFAHQYAGVKPDVITMAKGMGNGFPVGGLIINPEIGSWPGMLGTTFGGNHLACAATIAVLDIINKEDLINNAMKQGDYLIDNLANINGDFQIRGKGLMIGIEFPFPVKDLRRALLFDHNIFTGFSGSKILRLLPPLNLSKADCDIFLKAYKDVVLN